LDSLSAKQMNEIRQYLEGIPSLESKKEFVCSKCEYKEEMELKNLLDFFT
jgi:hypothetical protein